MVVARYGVRGVFGLYFIGCYFLSSIILHYKGEVIGFRLFRATGLAFAIRPKDGVAKQYYKLAKFETSNCSGQRNLPAPLYVKFGLRAYL